MGVFSYFAGWFRGTPKAQNPTHEQILKMMQEAKEKAENEAADANSRAEESSKREKNARKEKEEALQREQEARKRAQNAEAKLREAEAKSHEAEAKSREAEAKSREAEARLREAEAKLGKEQARFATGAEPKGKESEGWGLSSIDYLRLGRVIRPINTALEVKRAELDLKKCEAMVLETQKQEAEARMAADDARELQEQAEEAQRSLELGFYSSPEITKGRIQPEVWPTEEEFRSAKDRIKYDPEKIHFAVCGGSGSGKSSLINAFCGLKNNSGPHAAPTGVVETTKAITRYPDPRQEAPYNRLVWFDCPGAGTLKNPSSHYFNQKGLFIFDVIILVYDVRFTEIDVCIIQNCERFKIPLFIVRSKADNHIRSIMRDLGYYEDEGDAEEDYQARARQFLTDNTKKDIETNLQEAGLAMHDIFIVTSSVIYSLATNKQNEKTVIDEARLINSILKAAHERRYTTQAPSGGSLAIAVSREENIFTLLRTYSSIK